MISLKKNKKVFIIAEIGINHMGNLNLCKKLLLESKKAGADIAKLQIINPKTSYEKGTHSFKLFKKAEFDYRDLLKISNFCKKNYIKVFATPGDYESLNIVKKLNFPFIKISSGLNTNYPLIDNSIKLKKHLIVSTGMLSSKEIDKLYKYLKSKTSNFSLLKCTSVYPSKDKLLNLSAIRFFKKKYKCPIGYSDHTSDDLAVLIAVSMGAQIIEKHFTLNKKIKDFDHKISLEPGEFKHMVNKIRRIEKMKGKKFFSLSKLEKTNSQKFQRIIFLKKNVFKNNKLNETDVYFLRPLKKSKQSILAKDLKYFKGRVLNKDIKKNTQLKKKYFE